MKKEIYCRKFYEKHQTRRMPIYLRSRPGLQGWIYARHWKATQGRLWAEEIDLMFSTKEIFYYESNHTQKAFVKFSIKATDLPENRTLEKLCDVSWGSKKRLQGGDWNFDWEIAVNKFEVFISGSTLCEVWAHTICSIKFYVYI